MIGIVNSIGNRFKPEDVVSRTGLSLGTVRRYLNEMVKQGLVVEREGYYVLTDRALLLLEGRTLGRKAVGEAMAYLFTDEKGVPIAVKIDSIDKLYIAVRYGFIPEDVVLHHVVKGYIAKWLTETLGAKMLAQRLAEVKSVDHLLRLLEEYLGIRF